MKLKIKNNLTGSFVSCKNYNQLATNKSFDGLMHIINQQFLW